MPPRNPALTPSLRDLLVHLRLHFQLLLAPIFLWGFLLARGQPGPRAALAFVVFHLFLYGGATAYNSAYDRDEGPVGGLEHPPPVSAWLLPFSIALLLAGWLLSAAVSWALFAVYGAILAFALAYSYPRVRWKASPGASLATIFLGQGVLGFLGGWVTATGELRSALGADGALGALAASLVVTGFYPLTQLFQIEEDRARGDRTLAVAWGPAACFRLSQAAFILGGLAVLAIVLPRYGLGDAILSGLFFVFVVVAVEARRRKFDPTAVIANYRYVMRLNAVAALGLAGYAAWHLLSG
jgi:4-hydroxybenzoate polyprenyltransferase